MTADELAEHVAATLNEIEEKLIQFRAEKPDDVETIDAERADFGVFCVGNGEREEAFDRGNTCRRERVVAIAANGPVRGPLTPSLYQKQMEQLRLALEGTEFEGYVWRQNEPILLYDRQALLTRKRFLAMFEATFETFS